MHFALWLFIAVAMMPMTSHAQVNTVASASEDMGSLMDALFKNPTDLELNFRVMQAQIAEGNLEGAEATLERVLILDPSSTLAKILIADIKIKIGKYTSALLILNQLIEDPDTPIDTRDRAKGLAAQITTAIDPIKRRGGYAFYAGVSQNAFGRADDDEIKLLNLTVNNTTKKDDDPFKGYYAYYSSSQELDFQIPTILEMGGSISGRDTEHPDLSDTTTITVNAALKRQGHHVISGGVAASYTEVNTNDFSRNLSAFGNYSFPIADFLILNQSVSINRTIYARFPGISNNEGKSNRSIVAKTEFSRPTALAMFKLGLSAGKSNAKAAIYDFDYEKAQFSVLTLYKGFSISGSLSRQWTRYKTANSFISNKAQKTSTNEASVNIRYADGLMVGDNNYIPFLKLSANDSDSNIPNYTRNGSEVSMGFEGIF